MEQESNINNTYPKILYPNYYWEVKKMQIKVKDVYPGLIFPTYPKKEERKNDPLKVFLVMTILALIPIAFIYSFVTWIFDIEKLLSAYSTQIMISSAIVVSLIISYYNYKYVKKQNDYLETIYQKKCFAYEKQIEKYREKEREIKTLSFVSQYQKKIIREQANKFKEEILKFSKILSDVDIKKGVSELFFYDFLLKHSNYKVYKSLKFGYYYPDVVVIDLENNFVIDIEIDEPYIFDSKEPIHFDDIDITRDNYFTKNNFLVIRFSEDQIINHPKYCLDVINATTKNILLISEVKASNSSIIGEHEMLAWNHETAFSLAYNHSRREVDEIIKKARIEHL